MKLISLNTWGGRAGPEKLLEFLRSHKDADVFCLQEIWNNAPQDQVVTWDVPTPHLFSEIKNVLNGYEGFFRFHYYDWYGLAMFVKKEINILAEGDVFVHKEREDIIVPDSAINHARNLQYLTFETPGGIITILNFHGLWNNAGKNDTVDRLVQSDRILQFVNTISNPYVLCGDFNLLPQTASLRKFEDFGLKNLIKEYGVASTRTSFYKKEHRFADYILTSRQIKIKDFRVLPDEVSDHSPLYLEFE